MRSAQPVYARFRRLSLLSRRPGATMRRVASRRWAGGSRGHRCRCVGWYRWCRREQGPEAGALGLASATVVGVASTAPGYSLAASLGLLTLYVGLQAPAIMWIAFIPMACIAVGVLLPQPRRSRLRHQLHLGHPRDGTASGWMGGWSSMIADLVIMPSLACIAATYTFQLFGLDSTRRTASGRRSRSASCSSWA